MDKLGNSGWFNFSVSHYFIAQLLFIFGAINSAYASPWPVATTDSAEVQKNSSVTLFVLNNDTGIGLTVNQIDNWSVSGGQSSLNPANNSITYSPAPDFVGEDSFWYDIIDNEGRTNAAVVNITVVQSTLPPPSNAWPTATPDSVTTGKNNLINIHALDNDIGNGLVLNGVDNWTVKAGQASIINNTIQYTPAPDFVGIDSFWYDFVDNQGRTNAAEVTINVTESNTPPPSEYPVANTDLVSTIKNQTIYIPVLNNDSGKILTITDIDTWSVNAGRAFIDASNLFVSYTPLNGFSGNDSFWYSFSDNQGRSNAAEVKISVKPQNQSNFMYAQMHYGLLKNQPIVWGEIGSNPPYAEAIQNINLTSSATKGSTTLNVLDNSGLLPDQLIVYKATDGDYYVAQIKSLIANNKISLVRPLESSMATGQHIWNFYANPSHPNRYGYKAITDFSIRSLNLSSNTTGKHVLLGDSWFDNGGVSTQRFSQKLPMATIVNQGIGGNTSQNLIDRFENDVASQNPDYVWVICGTNDYWQGVTTAQFKANLNILISKIKAIGAQPIIIDSSVGSGTGPTGISNLKQSEEYVDKIIELGRE